jgi:hypothetical protein
MCRLRAHETRCSCVRVEVSKLLHGFLVIGKLEGLRGICLGDEARVIGEIESL